MKGKSVDQAQRSLFEPLLTDFIDLKHELILLSDKIDWSYFEKKFAQYYSNKGQSEMTIRLMISSLLLKRIYNLSDECLCES